MSSLGQALAVTFDSTEEFMVDSESVRCQVLWPEKQAQIFPPASPCLDSWLEVFVLICHVLVFTKCVAVCYDRTSSH